MSEPTHENKRRSEGAGACAADARAQCRVRLAQLEHERPLAALIDLLAGMNPRALAGREVLQRALIDWDVRSLQVQSERLAAIATADGSLLLRATAAAASKC